MILHIQRRPRAARIARLPRTLRGHYRIMRRYANRWDAACASLRLAWASVSV